MTGKVLEAILRLSFDKKALTDGRDKLAEVKKVLTALEGDAGELRAAIAAALAQGQAADQLKAKLGQVEQAIVDVQQAAKEGLAQSLFEQTKQQADRAKELADRLEGVSSRVAATGAGVGLGFYAMAQKYAEGAGLATATGRQWAAVTADLEQSQTRLGQATATALLPIMESVAELMETVANFAQANPGAMKAALNLAGGVAIVGGLGALAAQGVKMAMDAKTLAGFVLQNTAADKMLTAAGIQLKAAGGMGGGLLAKGAAAVGGTATLGAAGIGGALLAGGTVLGGLGYEGLRKVIPGGDKWGNTGQIVSTMALGAGNVAGKITGDDTLALKWFASVAHALGQIDDAAYNAAYSLNDAAEALAQPLISQEALDAYIGYQQQAAEAEAQYGEQRLGIVTRYGEQVAQAEENYKAQTLAAVEQYEAAKAQAEEDYQRRRDRGWRDFLQSQAKAQADYEKSVAALKSQNTNQAAQAENRYRQNVSKILNSLRQAEQQAETAYYQQRAKASQSYNLSVQRAEQDHQLQMRRMQEDHNAALEDSVRNQDAIGFLAEQRRYETQRQRSEADYQLGAGRNNEDYARQMAEMEQEYAAQKAQRQAAGQQQLADAQQQYAEEKAQRQADYQARLAEMQTQFEEQRAQRQTEFDQRRADEQADWELQQQRAAEQQAAKMLALNESHTAELTALQQAKTEQLNELDATHAAEKQKRDAAFADQLRAIDAALLGEKNTRSKYYAQMERDFTGWLTRMKAQVNSNLPGYPTGGSSRTYAGRGAGGYAANGLYRLGERGAREFVLSGPTTQAAERALGGPLSQDSLLAAMANGHSGGNRSLSYAPQYTFTERDDARLIMQQIEQAVDSKLLRLERGY